MWLEMDDPTGMWAAAANMAYTVECDRGRPSMLLRPTLKQDGNQWHAHFGEPFPEGVSGFGDSPYLAFVDFDEQWMKAIEGTETDIKQKAQRAAAKRQ